MYNVIIIDDEIASLGLMKILLSMYEKVNIMGTFTDSNGIFDVLNENIDAIFLDIEMPNENGLELAEKITEYNRTIEIVFVTAYNKYAVEAFELNALDYLLKPISNDRLDITLKRLISKKEQKNVEDSTARIECFNEFALYINDEKIKWRTSKVKELCAYLVNNNKEYVSADKLIDDLWPDYEFKKAKVHLHTSISYLRKGFTEYGFTEAVKYMNGSYKFNIDNIYCDVVDFENIVSGKDFNEESIKKIVEIYKGEYMGTEGYIWAYTKQEHIKETLIKAIKKAYRVFDEKKDIPKKIACLKKLYEIEPYSQKYAKKLIDEYINSGDIALGKQTYEDFAKRHIEDIGIDVRKDFLSTFVEC